MEAADVQREHQGPLPMPRGCVSCHWEVLKLTSLSAAPSLMRRSRARRRGNVSPSPRCLALSYTFTDVSLSVTPGGHGLARPCALWLPFAITSGVFKNTRARAPPCTRSDSVRVRAGREGRISRLGEVSEAPTRVPLAGTEGRVARPQPDRFVGGIFVTCPLYFPPKVSGDSQ